LKLVYSDRYAVDIGDHPWMTGKYAETLKQLTEQAQLSSFTVLEAPMADDQDILRTHTLGYWQKLCDVDFSDEEERLMELPVSSALVDLFWRMAGGSILATETTLNEGVCIHLGGGFHHAFPDHGAGFCLINDIVVSIQSVMSRGMADRVAVIDCDLHQGDGTAWIFKDDSSITTFSIHQRRTFPHFKQQSSIDIEVENGVSDERYLAMLADGLSTVSKHGPFDLIHYQAGADPYQKDTLGGLALTIEGLSKRDHMVIDWATNMGVPTVVTLGGGYPESITELGQIHANTALTAIEAAGRFRKTVERPCANVQSSEMEMMASGNGEYCG
jgi:acetoin utilization deacetylase AcuC-like enzyme